MTQDILKVRCACGWEATGTEADVVSATIEHGRRLHNMEATPEQVLAMAIQPEAAGPGTTQPTPTSVDAP